MGIGVETQWRYRCVADVSKPYPWYPEGLINKVRSVTDLGTILGTQVTVSEGHPWKQRHQANASSDIGGDFWTQRKHVESRFPRVTLRATVKSCPGVWTEIITDTPVWPTLPIYIGKAGSPLAFPPSHETPDGDLLKLGATAVARCSPTNSLSDVTTFLGELYREGLPRLGISSWEDRTVRAQKAGDDYLNYQFGWSPYLSELRSFATGIRRADEVLSQFERDSGKSVRRRYEFPSVTSEQTEFVYVDGPYYGPFNVEFMDPARTQGVNRTRRIEKRRWFSGAFTYHLPRGYDSRNEMTRLASQANVLFGLDLTPETVWNLTPWSWAADWFTNTGDVLQNLTDWSRYGLILRYGYIMEHVTVRDVITRVYPRPFKDKAISVPELVLVTETKKRLRANPFGFGITWESLSPFQLSILGALGLSRGTR